MFQFEKMANYHSTKSSLKTVRDAKLDELIDKVPLTADPAEKKKMALDAAVLAKNSYGALPFLDMNTVFVLGSRVGQLTPIKNMGGLSASLETITHAK